VGELEGRRPLRLAFQAREGLVGGWKGDGPSVSRFKRGRDWWVAGRKKAPPSCVLSKGGVGGCGWKEHHPEGWWWLRVKLNFNKS